MKCGQSYPSHRGDPNQSLYVAPPSTLDSSVDGCGGKTGLDGVESGFVRADPKGPPGRGRIGPGAGGPVRGSPKDGAAGSGIRHPRSVNQGKGCPSGWSRLRQRSTRCSSGTRHAAEAAPYRPLGYMELDRRGAELLFQVLTEREEKTPSRQLPTNRSPVGQKPSRTRACAPLSWTGSRSAGTSSKRALTPTGWHIAGSNNRRSEPVA